MSGLKKSLAYKCPVCGKIYEKYTSIYAHMKKKHKGVSVSNAIRLSLKDYRIIGTKIEDKEEQND
jgi:uncharacterized C2H2 Zn-finger protein